MLVVVQGVVSYFDSWRCILSNNQFKGKVCRAHVQSVLTYGTETWAMKAENLHSLERTECMTVVKIRDNLDSSSSTIRDVIGVCGLMCGVSLRDRKCSEDLYNLLGVCWECGLFIYLFIL